MKSLRILVVDDSGLTVKKMTKLLEDLGHEVAGRVTALGAGASTLAIGDRVAISPSRA